MKKLITITLLTLFISNCGDKVREEITERYDDGSKKLLVKFKGEGIDEVITERITFNENGDILILEKPLEKMKMVREYYENGQIKEEGNYKDGEEDGKYVEYYENGQIRIEANVKDGEPEDGKYTWYYENGQIKEEGNYKDGEKDGKWTDYHENRQISSEGNYKGVNQYGGGLRDGKWTYYNEDGSLKGEGIYKDGEIWNGLILLYYENRQIWIEKNYKDGKEDGKYTSYFENGQLKQEGNWKDGKLDGKLTYYYKNGQKMEEGNYKDGKLIE